MTKANRLEEMKRLYIQRAYTDIELAEKLGVSRETIFRDRKDLMGDYPVEQDDQGRWHIPKTKLISEIKLNLHEALTLYLAGRKTSRQTRFHQPHTVNAVEKLAATLRQPMTERLLKSAERLSSQEKNPEKIKIIETITQAWVEQRKVRIEYQALGNERLTRHTINPYVIEPSVWSDSVYVIARSDFNDQIFAFKMDRILSAFLSGETYEIPESFNDEQLLKHAWGIWVGGKDPVTVKLRFSPVVTRRVKESIWHPLEKVEDAEDGGCIWSVDIAEWREMLPWIRGWGADCEALEPKELREALEEEVMKMAELYRVMEEQVKKMVYYGHSRKDKPKSEWQPLIEHLTNTADLAEKFGADAGISELARTAALLHDIGKYSKEFQARLDGSKHKVDHATAGAKEIRNLFNTDQNQKSLADMLAYCIAGHHTGLPDYGDSTDVDGAGTLLARVEKKSLKDFSAYKTEIDTSSLNLKMRTVKTSKENQGFAIAFLTRMIFSALVDADFQETQNYMKDDVKPRGEHASIEELCETFNSALKKFDNPDGEINKKRTETLKACIEKANSEKGFFTLTIPTGGGKTLASMAFALNNAVKHGLKRVIYVIPFTSIIEQNAGIFKEYLGEENVLEHHSNFDWRKKRDAGAESPDDETNDVLDKLKLASENWDIPIVVTTNVQFFESLFANKSSQCRKLHNMAKSVIVFDEAQMLPREYLDPCMLAVKELVQNYGASAVFCTATQPALNKHLPNVSFTELAPDPQALFDFYKRVQVTNIGKTPDADLIEKIKAQSQALCIVNTRKHAKGLFDLLEKDDGRFHLSTLMCPTHRKETLKTIRQRLEDKLPCRVISTQVMEAGIDVDFPVGFRALAGLDSIIQAAGRVNREMKQDASDVFVFDPETEFIKKTPIFVQQGARVAENILRTHGKDPDSVPAIAAYFKLLDSLQGKGAYDAKKILSLFNKDAIQDGVIDFEFKKAAEDFKLIENNTVAVVIPYNAEAKKLLEQARHHPFPYTFARQLQMYTVNIYEKEFEKLQSKGVVETYNETYEVLASMDFYDEQTGLVLPAEAGGDALFIDR
ncbi:MAG TPA: CRISPR-associated helicase Cas3' [Anaerolineales bacterium]|nr:CRISPR-associated helicase Cas3' [Anaerolineales bacterium]